MFQAEGTTQKKAPSQRVTSEDPGTLSSLDRLHWVQGDREGAGGATRPEPRWPGRASGAKSAGSWGFSHSREARRDSCRVWGQRGCDDREDAAWAGCMGPRVPGPV